MRIALFWGYSHYFIFASAAAVGVGLGVAVDHASGHSMISETQTGYAIAVPVPVSVYLFFVWLLHLRPHQSGVALVTTPLGAILALATPLLPASIEVLAALLIAVVAGGGVKARVS